MSLFPLDLQSYLMTSTQGVYQHILNRAPKQTLQPIAEDSKLPLQKDTYFKDIRWVMARGHYAKVPGQKTYIDKVLNSPRISSMIRDLASKEGKQPYSQSKQQKPAEEGTLLVTKKALGIMKVMFADIHFGKLRAFALIMHKIF